MNLIEDRWIPVLRRSGLRDEIAPWQLTETGDPVLQVDALRPDFGGALIQLLIGLLQTTATKRTEREWAKWNRSPPGPQELRDLLAPVAQAFELDGDGPRILQDLDNLTDGAERTIDTLLIDIGGGPTHFVKGGNAERLCYPCAAMALLCLQLNSPAGGRGHMTSLRGGGPLTTLAEPDTEMIGEDGVTLWHLCWQNVLSAREFLTVTGDHSKTGLADIFPWMAATRTSEAKTGCKTLPDDVSPLQAYWGMPRRIRLDFRQTSKEPCLLCGRQGPTVFRYHTRPCGVSYDGPWRHPLSPHRDNGELVLAVHPRRGGIGYRDWAQLVLGNREGTTIPALVVSTSRNNPQRLEHRGRIWAFGYDMDKMKARCWYEYHLPVYHLEEQLVASLRDQANDLILAAEEVANNLAKRLKEAWFRKGETRGDVSFAVQSFWQRTEPVFYELIDELIEVIRKDADPRPLLYRWYQELTHVTLEIFELWSCVDIGHANPARIARAQRRLMSFNRNKTIIKALRLDEART